MTQSKLHQTIFIFFILSVLTNLFTLFKVFGLSSQISSLKVQVMNSSLGTTTNDNTLTAINKLSEEMASYRAEQVGRDQILGFSSSLNQEISTTPSITPTPTVTPSPSISPTPSNKKTVSLESSWNKTEAYEKPQSGSRILDHLQPNIMYEVIKLENGWYQIKINSLTNAFVQDQFVHEN